MKCFNRHHQPPEFSHEECFSDRRWRWHPPLQLSQQQVMAATGNLSGERVIGAGGYSTVYKGHLADGTPAAFKVLSTQDVGRARRAFAAEMDTLGNVRHRNLVRILGSSRSPRMLAIVMDYVPNGTLEQHLHAPTATPSPLSWDQTFSIIRGISNALAYLHHDLPFPIVHCDLKPSNIYLDLDLEPHLGDFGASRWVPSSPKKLSSFRQQLLLQDKKRKVCKVTTKGDVYTYGVVVLEMLTRKRPTCEFLVDYGSLAKWAFSKYPAHIEEVLDPYLLSTSSVHAHKEMNLVLRLALLCTQENPYCRPTMRNVVSILTWIRQPNVNHHLLHKASICREATLMSPCYSLDLHSR